MRSDGLNLVLIFVLVTVIGAQNDSNLSPFLPDGDSCYTIKNRLNQLLVFSDNSLSVGDNFLKKAAVKKVPEPENQHTWRFELDNSTPPKYRIVNCETSEALYWSVKDTARNKMNYVILSDSPLSRSWRSDWTVMQDNSSNYQIFAYNSKFNLFTSTVKQEDEILGLVWTGTDPKDWTGKRNYRRLWKLDAIDQSSKGFKGEIVIDETKLQKYISTLSKNDLNNLETALSAIIAYLSELYPNNNVLIVSGKHSLSYDFGNSVQVMIPEFTNSEYTVYVFGTGHFEYPSELDKSENLAYDGYYTIQNGSPISIDFMIKE